jgi:hypothetical protein
MVVLSNEEGGRTRSNKEVAKALVFDTPRPTIGLLHHGIFLSQEGYPKVK